MKALQIFSTLQALVTAIDALQDIKAKLDASNTSGVPTTSVDAAMNKLKADFDNLFVALLDVTKAEPTDSKSNPPAKPE